MSPSNLPAILPTTPRRQMAFVISNEYTRVVLLSDLQSSAIRNTHLLIQDIVFVCRQPEKRVFSDSVSERALIILLPIFASFAHDGYESPLEKVVMLPVLSCIRILMHIADDCNILRWCDVVTRG